MGIKDTQPAKGQTGEKLPKGVNASDMSGERKGKLKGGVAMGKEDGIGGREPSHAGMNDGRLGEFKGGAREHECYSHKRTEHAQDSM